MRTPYLANLLAPLAAALVSASVAHAQPASLTTANHAYVQTPHHPDFAMQQFTLSTWLRPTGPGENGGGTLIGKSGRPETGSNLCSWWMGWSASSGKVLGLVVHEYAVSSRSITSNTSVPIGQWALATMTFDGTTIKLYINGVLDHQVNYGFSGVYYQTEPVKIGAFHDNTGYTFNHFDGNLDEVAIWNRALSSDEVAALASCANIISPNGLVLHIPFTNQQLTDISGHAHNAAPIGTIAFASQATSTAPCCDSIDFNNDTSLFDPQDIEAFLSVYSEGPCVPSIASCNDIDFNNDSSLFDPCDIDAFLLVFSEGPCTPCGQ